MTRPLLAYTLITLFPLLVIVHSAPLQQTHNSTCEIPLYASTQADYDWTSDEALALAQCMQRIVPRTDSCVFYTSGNRDSAIFYANEKEKTTIYDVYSPASFDTQRFPASQWLSSGNLRNVFRVTSRAYAMSCSGRATLVIEQDARPCKESIWMTDEYDAIKKKLSSITSVWRASPFLTVDGVWAWIERRMQGAEETASVEKRSLSWDTEAIEEQITLGLDSVMHQQAELRNAIQMKIDAALAFGLDDLWALDTPCNARKIKNLGQ